MNAQFLSVLAYARPEISQVMMTEMHMAKTDRSVRILTTLPMFDTSSVGQMIQQTGVQILMVDAHLAGFSLSEVLQLRQHSKRPFLLVGLANAGSPEAEAMAQTQKFDALFATPLSILTIDRINQELPPLYEKVTAGWGKGVWDSSTSDDIRAVMQSSAGSSWSRSSIAVWSPKGGVGKTTCAVELAATLAAIGGRQIAIVDANMNGGHVWVRLHVESQTGIVSAAADYKMVSSAHNSPTLRGEFNQRLQTTYMTSVPGCTNLHALAGVKSFEEASHDALKAECGMEFMIALIRQLKLMYDFVIVDMGSSLNVGVHRGVFHEVDNIVVVGTPDFCGLVDIKNGIRTLTTTLNLNPGRFLFVLNQWQDNLDVDVRNAAEIVGLSAIAAIPMDGTGSVTACGNKGISYVAKYSASKNNPPEIEETLKGFVTVAAHFYAPIAAAWSSRGGKIAAPQATEKKKSFFGLGRGK